MFSTFSTFLLPNKDKVADTHSLSLSESPPPPFFLLVLFFLLHFSHFWGHNILKYNSWCWCASINRYHGFYFGPCTFAVVAVDVLLMLFLIKKACVQVKQHREDIFVIPLRFGCVVKHDVNMDRGLEALKLALQGLTVYWTQFSTQFISNTKGIEIIIFTLKIND